MRDIVTQSPVLAFYDLKKELTLKVDASEKATTATLMQEDRMIEYMSRALDESKQNWATIKHEMLAIIHGRKRFHQYMTEDNCRVRSQTTGNHHAQTHIVSTKVSTELQKYQYDISIIHRLGKDIPVTDCLNRNLIENVTLIEYKFSDKVDVTSDQ